MKPSAATRKAYMRRAQLLFARMQKERPSLGITSYGPMALVEWLRHKKSALSVASWRHYRASVVFMLRALADDSQTPAEVREEAARAAEILAREGQSGCIRKPDRTSAKKAKRSPDGDLTKLLACLDANADNWRWARLTTNWVRAGVLTGLRPVEWQHAELSTDGEGTTWLVVENAKRDELRGNGPTRRLQLSTESGENPALAAVSIHLELLKSLSETMPFEKLYAHTRDCLRHANQVAFRPRNGRSATSPKARICLYTLRHQFTANAKASGLTKSEVAALLGHASDQTAGLHYARRVSGKSGLAVQPDPGAVATVRCEATDHGCASGYEIAP